MYHEQQKQQATADVLDSGAGEKSGVTLPLQATVHVCYEDRQSMVAGVILIIAGVLSILITGIGIGFYNTFTILKHGIWIGVVVSIRYVSQSNVYLIL